MNLVLLGAPGSGKGTMAETLVKQLQVVHIATGDIFRSNIKNNTELGKEAKSYIDQGKLVPDSVTINMVKDRLSQPDVGNGFMLDGFPRTIEQANALADILKELNYKLDLVLAVDVPEQLIVERLSGRRVCLDCGASYHIVAKAPKQENVCDNCNGEVVQRDDDKSETVIKRLETYEAQTKPLLAYYEQQGIVRTLDNSGSYAESQAKLAAILETL